MKAADFAPSNSKYVKSSDLEGKQLIVTISKCVIERMQDGEEKGVMYFKGGKKGMVVNVTNRKAMEGAFGDDTDDWIGKKIKMFTVQTQNPAGDIVEGLRVLPADAGASRPAPKINNTKRKSAKAEDVPVDDLGDGEPPADLNIEEETIPF